MRTNTLAALAALLALGLSILGTNAADLDQDGLDDVFEGELMNRFAPVVKLHPDDDYRPASVDWYLARVKMRFHHPHCADHTELEKGEVNVSSMIAQRHHESNLICEHNDNVQNSGTSNPRPSRANDFYLEVPDNANHEQTRRGSLASARCYAHVRKAAGHPFMYDVQYWFFYPYNGPIDFLGSIAHEGDWEHITVRIERDGLTIHRIYFSAHYGEGKWYREQTEGRAGYRLTSDGRPIVYSAWHSHASYPWAGEWERDNLPNDFASGSGPTWDCRGVTSNIGEDNQPFAGMQWIQYTGHWGELGNPAVNVGPDVSTGPYGPAFQDSWSADATDGDNPASHDWVFVDRSSESYLGGGGSWSWPYTSFTRGAEAVPSGGTIWVYPGTYSAVGTYSKPMTVIAPEGNVTLGD